MKTEAPWLSGGRRTTLIAAALVLALTYVAVALFTDANQLLAALQRLGWWGCAAVFGLSGLNYFVRFQRWKGFLSRLGRDPPMGRHFLYYLSGFAFSISPAKAGEAVRSLYLRDHGVSYAQSIAAFFVERLLDLGSIVILSSLIVLDHPAYRFLVVASSVLVAIVIIGVCQSSLPPLINRLSGARSGRIARLGSEFANLLRSARVLLHPQPLLFGILLGLIAWGAEGLGFGVLCQGLHIDGSLWSFCGIYAVAVLAGSAAFFLPAGIGGMELVMSTLLVQQGAELRVAIIATLLCRLATLWFAVLVGIAAASVVELLDRRRTRVQVNP